MARTATAAGERYYTPSCLKLISQVKRTKCVTSYELNVYKYQTQHFLNLISHKSKSKLININFPSVPLWLKIWSRHASYSLMGKGMAERYMDRAVRQRQEENQPTNSGSGTSSCVPEGATTARRVSPWKALQMSSWVTYLCVRRGLRKFTPHWKKNT